MSENRSTMLYKLTDRNNCSHGGTIWGTGVEHTAPGTGELCTSGWLHAYTDPLLAVLLNPIHASIAHPILWEAEGDIGKTDNGLKVGCTRLRTLRRITLPVITTEQRVRWGILCTMAIYPDAGFSTWADGWISGADRSESAAWAAAKAAWSAAWSAAARSAWAAETLDLVGLAHQAMAGEPVFDATAEDMLAGCKRKADVQYRRDMD